MADNKDYVIRPEEKGSINISEEVIAIIAATAALETEGVSSLNASLGKDIAELLGKKSLSKGVKVTSEEDGINIDVYIHTKLGTSVNKIGCLVQENVLTAVESMTGIKVLLVNVHVCGVSLDRAK